MAHAAMRTKNSYFKSQYHRLAGRRGKKRAIGAVKHSLLVTVYFMLRDHKPYKDLGVDYFDKLNPQQRIRYHVRKLQDLGQEVELSPMAERREPHPQPNFRRRQELAEILIFKISPPRPPRS